MNELNWHSIIETKSQRPKCPDLSLGVTPILYTKDGSGLQCSVLVRIIPRNKETKETKRMIDRTLSNLGGPYQKSREKQTGLPESVRNWKYREDPRYTDELWILMTPYNPFGGHSIKVLRKIEFDNLSTIQFNSLSINVL